MNAAAIDTDTSLEQAVETALRSEQPCEAGAKGNGCQGNNPARWYGIRSCTCPIDTWCDADRRIALSYIAIAVNLHCNICGADPVAVRFEPIR